VHADTNARTHGRTQVFRNCGCLIRWRALLAEAAHQTHSVPGKSRKHMPCRRTMTLLQQTQWDPIMPRVGRAPARAGLGLLLCGAGPELPQAQTARARASRAPRPGPTRPPGHWVRHLACPRSCRAADRVGDPAPSTNETPGMGGPVPRPRTRVVRAQTTHRFREQVDERSIRPCALRGAQSPPQTCAWLATPPSPLALNSRPGNGEVFLPHRPFFWNLPVVYRRAKAVISMVFITHPGDPARS